MKLKTATLFTVITVITLSVLACTNNKKAEDGTKVEETASEATQVPSAENSTTNDGISFLDESKKVIVLNDLKGKVVFINFWATWCPPCIQEMPSINNLKKRYKDNPDIVFMMVDVDNNYEGSKKFMEKNGYDLPLYMPDSKIPPHFLGNSIPTTVILDKSGQMAARLEGGRDYAAPEIMKAMDDLVAGK